MAFTRNTIAVNNIQGQPDQPIISATALKTLFDKTGSDEKAYNNDVLLVELEAPTAASSLGQNNGSYGATIQSAIDTITSAGSGTIPPDGTITNLKLATDVKVGSLASSTTTAKSSVIAVTNEINNKIDTLSGATLIDTLSTVTSGNWVVPAGVNRIGVVIIGGGGGGGSGAKYTDPNVSGGSGGGAGYVSVITDLKVTVGQSIPYVVGDGGLGGVGVSGGAAVGLVGVAGSTSSFYGITANGGGNGLGGNASPANQRVGGTGSANGGNSFPGTVGGDANSGTTIVGKSSLLSGLDLFSGLKLGAGGGAGGSYVASVLQAQTIGGTSGDGGVGGSGSAGILASTPADGGAGSPFCGGGGGGFTTSGAVSGKGGKGGRGEIRIYKLL